MNMKMTRENGGFSEPEMRLPALFIYACFLPVGLILYGWTADKHVHWIASIIGLGPLGFGMMSVFLPIQTYLVDAFHTPHSVICSPGLKMETTRFSGNTGYESYYDFINFTR